MLTSAASQNTVSEKRPELTGCDQELIHLMSRVQSHGCLLGINWTEQRVTCASENVGDFLHLGHAQILGAKLEPIFGREFMARASAAVVALTANGGPGRAVVCQIEKRKLDGYLFTSGELVMLELQDSHSSNFREPPVPSDERVRDYMQAAKAARTLTELAALATRAVRDLTGFDRVMIYRFLRPNYHGEVIAEDRVASINSFLNHRFPSSDIPRPARELYLRNGLRQIADVNAPTSAIAPLAKPMDLSDSRLRSVSEVHLEYLRNMGVVASYSFALTVGDQLWGLVACHHLAPLQVPPMVLRQCEIVAHAFSARAELLEVNSEQATCLRFESGLMALFASLRSKQDPLDELFRRHRDVESIFSASGFALVAGERVDFAGLTPPRMGLQELTSELLARLNTQRADHLVFQSQEELGDLNSHLQLVASGLLAVRVQTKPGQDGILILFRSEIIQSVTWGGDPQKNLQKKNFAGRINPRESFSAWEEVVRGKAASWHPYEIEGARFLRDLIFEVLIKNQALIHELSRELRQVRITGSTK